MSDRGARTSRGLPGPKLQPSVARAGKGVPRGTRCCGLLAGLRVRHFKGTGVCSPTLQAWALWESCPPRRPGIRAVVPAFLLPWAWRPAPPWREACLSGLAPGRARHTETPLCTPHRATWKVNGSAVLGGRTTGHPGWEARVSEPRPAGRSRLCRGMGPGSLGSLAGAAVTPGPVPSRSCPSPTVAQRPREVCSWGRPCSPS